MNITPLAVVPLSPTSIQVRALSVFSGKTHEMTLPISLQRLNAWFRDHTLIQEAFPELTDDQREFLLTGAVPGEWEAEFPPPIAGE